MNVKPLEEIYVVLSRWMLLFVVGLGNSNNHASIRRQETLLATALRTADRTALLELTDSRLHVVVQCGSPVKFLSTDLSREDWIGIVTQARTINYNSKVDEISLVPQRSPDGQQNKNLATAKIVETINLLTPDGAVEKKLFAWDTWIKLDDMWKLANRVYRPVCEEGPRLRFP